MNKPLVTVCCITYNHSKYIEECIDGFLSQITDFPIEFIIHDDASTDNTQALIENKVKSDSRFNLILRKKNIKSTGVAIFPLLFKEAQGKYIAMCEGDDYWTDPLKLQKQVDFLENDPDFTICHHHFNRIDAEGKLISQSKEKQDVITLESYLKKELRGGLGQTCTLLFRNDSNILKRLHHLNYGGDTILFLALLQNNKKAKFLNYNMANYRIHNGGIWSLQNKLIKTNHTIETFSRLIVLLKDEKYVYNIYYSLIYKCIELIEISNNFSQRLKIYKNIIFYLFAQNLLKSLRSFHSLRQWGVSFAKTLIVLPFIFYNKHAR